MLLFLGDKAYHCGLRGHNVSFRHVCGGIGGELERNEERGIEELQVEKSQ